VVTDTTTNKTESQRSGSGSDATVAGAASDGGIEIICFQ